MNNDVINKSARQKIQMNCGSKLHAHDRSICTYIHVNTIEMYDNVYTRQVSQFSRMRMSYSGGGVSCDVFLLSPCVDSLPTM